MTSTPRLDHLVASGTNGGVESIRLADGHVLTLRTRPDADVAEGVFLFRDLIAPETAAWEETDPAGKWLDNGSFTGSLHLEVPIEAVRELIIEHGGEHENQKPPTEEQIEAEDMLERIADLHGRFADGYSADGIRTVFGRIFDEDGPYLVCVWEYADKHGFGGNSEFYVEDDDFNLFEVHPDVHHWLTGQRDTPGPVASWTCAPVAERTDFPVTDDFHNYARADRTDD
ncbi:hypothetical protein ACFW5W_28455 [Streptomyces sp. NPDC058783]|uniref:hypothetical protein n=1 Tax=Streptomyces sp. NPDC058783 TaxID=3346633 RepID=UPI0036BBD3D4